MLPVLPCSHRTGGCSGAPAQHPAVGNGQLAGGHLDGPAVHGLTLLVRTRRQRQAPGCKAQHLALAPAHDRRLIGHHEAARCRYPLTGQVVVGDAQLHAAHIGRAHEVQDSGDRPPGQTAPLVRRPYRVRQLHRAVPDRERQDLAQRNAAGDRDGQLQRPAVSAGPVRGRHVSQCCCLVERRRQRCPPVHLVGVEQADHDLGVVRPPLAQDQSACAHHDRRGPRPEQCHNP